MEFTSLRFSLITDFLDRAGTAIHSASLAELLCVMAAPLLAMLIGIRARRYFDTHPQKTFSIELMDFVAPLISPALGILFVSLAVTAFSSRHLTMLVLPFELKLAIAWMAVQFVYLMSTKRLAGWFIALAIIPITLLQLFGLWEITTAGLIDVKFSIGKEQFNLYQILKGIIALIAMQWVASLLINVTDNRLKRVRTMRHSNRTLILKILQIFLYCFIVIAGMQMIGINLTALSVFGGALGVGLGFGLQRTASNFISGMILLFEKSIEVDDLIELADGTTGWVRQTYARYTLLEMQDGKELLIPNEEFTNQRVVSWTHSNKKARIEIILTISYDSDLEAARAIMLAAANNHPKRLKSIEPLALLHNFKDNGIELRLLFWISDVTDGRMGPRSEVMDEIWREFRKAHIRIPLPQREMHIITEDEHHPFKAKSGEGA